MQWLIPVQYKSMLDELVKPADNYFSLILIGCRSRAHQDASAAAPHSTFDQIAGDVAGQYRLNATLQTGKSLHCNHRLGIRWPV